MSHPKLTNSSSTVFRESDMGCDLNAKFSSRGFGHECIEGARGCQGHLGRAEGAFKCIIMSARTLGDREEQNSLRRARDKPVDPSDEMVAQGNF